MTKDVNLELSNDHVMSPADPDGAPLPLGVQPNHSKANLLEEQEFTSNLLYRVNDSPPWYTCIALGLQHFLLMVESTVSIPYLITPMMCMAQTDPNRGHIASTIIFVSGLVTVLQSTFGVRLPIIQGGSHGFLGPVLAILSLMPCPSEEALSAMSPEEREDVWQLRMQHIQGAICWGALFQVIIGFSGIVGLILKWVTPLTITPTISLIGLSLFKITATKIASNWWISSLTVLLLVLFSQYLAHVAVPWFSCSNFKASKSKVHVFQMFPVLLALVISWLVCYLLTIYEVLDKDDHARTDLRLSMIYEAPWFSLPYPGQFGLPHSTLAGVLGVSAAICATVVESIGDYYACARLADVPPPPKHAVNRGIWMEGLGTVMAGLFGTSSGTTSFSQNVAAIGITGVGSRRVIQYAGAIMIVCGVIGKIGALFINIPEPVIGGIFVIVFSMITSVGLSNLQFVNLNSSRNLFVLGFSIFIGLTIPEWMGRPENQNALQTSVVIIDQILTVLLRIPMFVGGFIGFFLDNTLPGTKEERGLIAWEAEKVKHIHTNATEGAEMSDQCYDLPFQMNFIRNSRWLKYLPISPTFEGWGELRRRQKSSKEGLSH